MITSAVAAKGRKSVDEKNYLLYRKIWLYYVDFFFFQNELMKNLPHGTGSTSWQWIAIVTCRHTLFSTLIQICSSATASVNISLTFQCYWIEGNPREVGEK